MVPLSRGGDDKLHNMIGACGPCNAEKRTRNVSEYRDYKKAKTGNPDFKFWFELKGITP
jgi:hypothetical protein